MNRLFDSFIQRLENNAAKDSDEENLEAIVFPMADLGGFFALRYFIFMSAAVALTGITQEANGAALETGAGHLGRMNRLGPIPRQCIIGGELAPAGAGYFPAKKESDLPVENENKDTKR